VHLFTSVAPIVDPDSQVVNLLHAASKNAAELSLHSYNHLHAYNDWKTMRSE